MKQIVSRANSNLNERSFWLFISFVAFSLPTSDAIGQNSGLRIGTDRDQYNLPRSNYEKMHPSDKRRAEDALQDICPAFLIEVNHKNLKKGEVVIVNPLEIDTQPEDIKRLFHSKQRDNLKKRFCELYKDHRAGCNMLWTLQNSTKPINIWRTEAYDDKFAKASGESRMRPGHVGWNPASTRGAPTVEDPRAAPDTPPVWALAHELVHSYRWVVSKFKDDVKFGEQDEEFAAVRGENQIRSELRKLNKYRREVCLSSRTQYRGELVPRRDIGVIDISDKFDCDKQKEIKDDAENNDKAERNVDMNVGSADSAVKGVTEDGLAIRLSPDAFSDLYIVDRRAGSGLMGPVCEVPG